jgi:hypothetical protein
MLDVRPTAYTCPIAEQEIGPLTPTIRVQNFADEDATITGLVRIYREALGVLIYSSVLHPTPLAHGLSANIAAETPWNPGAPAAHDYFILAEVSATSLLSGNELRSSLGQYFFDITPAPMGPPPETHHTTHELGGMDPVDVTGMSGVLGDPQTPANHVTTHEDGGADPLNVENLPTLELDDALVLAPDGAGGVEFRAEAVGGNIEAMPTAEMDDTLVLAPDGAGGVEFRAEAVGASHARQHAITDTDDHTSGATPAQLLQADAYGLPVDATNSDAEVTDAVDKRNCRANGEASNATPTPNADTTDLYYLTALAEAATFGAPTGTPGNGQKLLIRILDNATARALAWNSGAGGYIARGVALPTTTVLSKYLYVGLIYNSVASKWDCVATSQEA